MSTATTESVMYCSIRCPLQGVLARSRVEACVDHKLYGNMNCHSKVVLSSSHEHMDRQLSE